MLTDPKELAVELLVMFASVIAGAASWIALLSLVLLVVPAMAVVFGIVAFIQVRRSHGTQGGAALAGLGILLGLVAGGYVTYDAVNQHRQRLIYTRQIRETFDRFGQALSRGDFDAAYAFTEPRFRERVSPGAFRATLQGFNQRRASDGTVESVLPLTARTNDRAQVTYDPATGVAYAEAMLILEYPDDRTLRQVVRMIHFDGAWHFSAFGDWFTDAP